MTARQEEINILKRFYIFISKPGFNNKWVSIFIVVCIIGTIIPAKAPKYFFLIAELNHSSQTGSIVNGDIEFSSIQNFVVGGMLGTALTKNLEVHFESVFLRKGAKQTGAQESFGDFTIVLSPIMLKYLRY